MNTNNQDMRKKISLYQKIVLTFFGLFLTVIILEIVLRMSGFVILFFQEYNNSQSIKQKNAYRVLCLGESTTQNEYPRYLEDFLNQRKIGVKFSVIDKGLPGKNTDFILSQLETNLDKYKPDIVVTMMGINDSGDKMSFREAAVTSETIQFFCSWKVYKLIKLIWLHMVTKFKERSFYDQGINKQKYRFKEADSMFQQKQAFEKALGLNLNNEDAGKKMGWVYIVQRRPLEAEQFFKKAIELDHNNNGAYEGLGWVYMDQGRLLEAAQLFKKAIELNPDNNGAYEGLGRVYIDQGRLLEAEQFFKKAIELDHNNNGAYEGLGWVYLDQGRLLEAAQLFKKAIKLNPDDNRLCGILAMIYLEMDNNKLFEVYLEKTKWNFGEVYLEKTNKIEGKYYHSMTITNYRRLKQIVEKRKIKLVCVQYPMCNLEPLKRIFGEESHDMIFVNNEEIFKNAIRKEGYTEYFRDIFAGNFGHCTPKGNRLLAENIAHVISKEILEK